MTVLFCFVTAILGVVLGGFIGRAAYALPRGEYREIIAPTCPSCGRSLPLKCSLPLVGSFLSRRRCPHCGERRSVSVFCAEVLFGAAALLLYLVYGFSYLYFLYLVTIGALLLLSLIDLDIREAPHSVLFVILLLGSMNFGFSFFSFSSAGTAWWEHLVGAFVISLPLFLLTIFTGGVGGGDVKLMFVLGLLLGYKLTLVAFFVGVVAAAIAAVILHFACGKGGKFALPLIPFLSFGALLSLLVGERLIGFFF